MKKDDDNVFTIQYGGRVKELNCEPEEAEMFGILCKMYEDTGRDSASLVLERYSKDYLSVKLGEWDVVRIHWGPRSKWILFPAFEKHSERHKIFATEDIRAFSDLLQKTVEHIEKYS